VSNSRVEVDEAVAFDEQSTGTPITPRRHNKRILDLQYQNMALRTEEELRAKAAQYLRMKSAESTCFNRTAEKRVPRFEPRGKLIDWCPGCWWC